jgi:hypothetical protein
VHYIVFSMYIVDSVGHGHLLGDGSAVLLRTQPKKKYLQSRLQRPIGQLPSLDPFAD